VDVKRMAQPVSDVVRWHDLECGGYRADLPLWRELAAAVAPAPVLDLGAGSGRVALDLAAHGHEVAAVELDAELAGALRDRAAGLSLQVVCADAREISLGRSFGLVIVAMQTVQLMGGSEGRIRLLARVREHLAPGGVAGVAIVTRLEPFDGPLAIPDTARHGDELFVSQPTAVRREPDSWVLERRRERVQGDERRPAGLDVIRIDRLSQRALVREAAAVGLRPMPARRIEPTAEHSGALVVTLGG
jgi:SAM-dependent methyltransferase